MDSSVLKKKKFVAFLLFTIPFLVLLIANYSWGITLRFLGGAGEIGGSSTLLDTGKEKILIDCGSVNKGEGEKGGFSFDPSSIDCLFVTHAHIDHLGRIPELIERGFTGRIIGTEATRELLSVVLRKMHVRGSERALDSRAVERILTLYESYTYGRTVNLRQGLTFRLHNAGHILGSAMVEIIIGEDSNPLSFLFTGDLGSHDHLFLDGPSFPERADYVIVEGTYGPVKKMKMPLEMLGERIRETLKAGGSVLIPAFTLDRTQQILFAIRELKTKGLIPEYTPVYAHSKTAKEITDIYKRFRSAFKPEVKRSLPRGIDPFHFPGLKWVSSKVALNTHLDGRSAIYVTSGGTLDYGIVFDHLSLMAEDPKNLLVLVGHQQAGSLGDRLLKGQRTVCVPQRSITNGKVAQGDCLLLEVRMSVMYFQGFAGHGDGYEILEWLSRIRGIRKVFVVHGDYQAVSAMAQAIRSRLGLEAVAPRRGEVFVIDWGSQSKDPQSVKRRCAVCK